MRCRILTSVVVGVLFGEVWLLATGAKVAQTTRIIRANKFRNAIFFIITPIGVPESSLHQFASRNRAVIASQQRFESRIGSQPFQSGVDAHEGEANGVLTFRLFKPTKSTVPVTQPTINNGDLVG